MEKVEKLIKINKKNMSNSDITKEELVRKLDGNLYGLAYKDIKEIISKSLPELAIFILCACFIDAMASFYFGVTKENMGGSGVRFKEFVKKYLTQYNADDLYHSLRCGLVHSYADEGKYKFIQRKSLWHQKSDCSGKRKLINDENFADDVEKAYFKFREDVLLESERFDRAKERYLDAGLMEINLI